MKIGLTEARIQVNIETVIAILSIFSMTIKTTILKKSN